MEEDREPFAYEYTHENGGWIITRAHGGNTYCGSEATAVMLQMYRRMRYHEFAEPEFNNYLIAELNRRPDWAKTNRYVLPIGDRK